MNLSPDSPLRIGVLGAAKIARLFVDGVRPSRKVVVAAVASRDVDRATAFARDAGVAMVHPTYEALLHDPEIDAIYVPLPNNLHAAWSIRAADAGKHVLCEKPLAATAAEARAVFEAARANGVYVVEAYPYRAQPQTLKMRELLTADAIGKLQLIQASFGFPLTDVANIRMNPTLAGGALMDAGSYPVSLVRTIAGTKPTRVFAISRWLGSRIVRRLALEDMQEINGYKSILESAESLATLTILGPGDFFGELACAYRRNAGRLRPSPSSPSRPGP